MKFFLTSFMILFSLRGVFAQEKQVFNLEECIDYAALNAVTMQNAILDQEIAVAKVKETIGIGLPQITGSVGLQHSPTLARFFGTYQPGSPFGVDAATASQLGIQPGDVFAAKNFFQLQSAGDAKLSVQQLIFNGSYLVGLQASNAYKDLSVRQANQTKEEIVLNVSKAYYNLLIMREQEKLIQSNIDRVDTLLFNTQALVENGFAEKIDADRLKVTLNNLKTEQLNLANMEKLSVRLLMLQMNYPFDRPFQVSGELADVMVEAFDLPEQGDWSYNVRPDYQVFEANRKLQQLNIKNKYAEGLPTIAAFATLGRSTQSPDFNGLFQANSSFTEVEDQIGVDGWYDYSSVGLSLNWSIFTGLQRNFQIQQEKLELQKLENGFVALEKQIELEIQQSGIDQDNALKQLSVQTENKDLAEEIYNIAKIKYEEGVGSNLEVIEANTSFKEAQTNYYSALYNAIIAQLELKKALGTLLN